LDRRFQSIRRFNQDEAFHHCLFDGTVNKFKGSIDIDDNQIKDATIEFTLDVNTDNKLELIDTHMKLNDLFDIHNYPSISFKSTSFKSK
jgi:polyisoprenoid-binding protein YceI